MKYTIMEKIFSILKNLARTNLKQYGYFFRKTKKAKLDFENRFPGDTTKEEDYDSRDYTFDGSEDLPQLPNTVRYVVDQSEQWRTRNGCVPISMMMTLYHNSGRTPVFKEILAMLDYLEKEGVWFESYGASAPQVIHKLVAEWNRLNPNALMEYRRVLYGSEGVSTLLSKGYVLAGGRNTFLDYSKDVLDGKIDSKDYPGWKRAGGHYVTVMDGNILRNNKIIQIFGDESQKQKLIATPSEALHVVNQYPTAHGKLNIYEHNLMSDHTAKSIWYTPFYCILPVDRSVVETPRIEDSLKGYEYIDTLDEEKYNLKEIIKWLVRFQEKDPLIFKDVSELSEEDKAHSAIASKIRQGL